MLKNPYAPVIEPTLEDKVQHFIAHALEAAKGTARFKELSEKFETLEASLRGKVENSEGGRQGFFKRMEKTNAAMQELVSYILTVDPSPIDEIE